MIPTERPTPSQRGARGDRLLRIASVVFISAVLVHSADHLRRGLFSVPVGVQLAGFLQLLLAVMAVVLVWRRHPLAPHMAVAVGFGSAVGFVFAHLLPVYWPPLSDSFVDGRIAASGVNGFSWFAVGFEILADLFFALAGVRSLRSRGSADATTGSRLARNA